MTIVAWTEGSSLWERQVESLRTNHPHISVTVTTDAKAPEIPRAEIIIGHTFPEEVLRRATNLRVLAVAMAGLDHLPNTLLAERGVQVINAHANGRYVAERVLALTLGALGKLVPYHQDLTRGRWHGFAAKEPVRDSWQSLVGMRTAILGTGAIGTWTARLYHAFECRTVGFKRQLAKPRKPFDEITPDLLEAVEGADVVVNTLPLTDHTVGLIDGPVFTAMQGALFVNVGRGSVADEEALYHALTTGVLRGAAIDTWYNYPENGETVRYPATLPFHTLDNVLLSPHVGGYTAAATKASLAEVFEAVDTYLTTDALTDPADPAEQY